MSNLSRPHNCSVHHRPGLRSTFAHYLSVLQSFPNWQPSKQPSERNKTLTVITPPNSILCHPNVNNYNNFLDFPSTRKTHKSPFTSFTSFADIAVGCVHRKQRL